MAMISQPSALLTVESDGVESRVVLPDGSVLAGVTSVQINIRPGEVPTLRLEIARFNAAIEPKV